MTRFRMHLVGATLAALVSLAAPVDAGFSGLAGWAGPCAQSMGLAPGCNTVPPPPRGPRISPEELQQEEQQREEKQKELDELQQEREAAEAAEREAEAADALGVNLQNQGDLQGAIGEFIRALDLAPGNATIRAHLEGANRALAKAQYSAAVVALRHRIENEMASARINALRKDLEAQMLSRRLVAFYNSFVTAPPSQAKVDCVANSSVVFGLKLGQCERQNLTVHNCLRNSGMAEKSLACLATLPITAPPAYLASCGYAATSLESFAHRCVVIDNDCLDDALKEQKTRTAACANR
jgi:tetratricopeptide (TPR) repeat protein